MADPKAANRTPPRAVLKPPEVQRVRYQRNLIKTAVCELRFPTLLELEARPPVQFQKKLRKAYPFYQSQIIDLSGGDEVAREHRYLFRSKDQHWTVSVKSFALSIETSKYLDFEDFFSRFKQVFASATGMIDADFFTRIGLRYINTIPLQDGIVEGWVRAELVAPLTSGVLGEATKFAGIIQGEMENGHYSIRHGMKDDPERALSNDNITRHEEAAKRGPMTSQVTRTYQLDFDYYSENVEMDAVESYIEQFNRTNFALFNWCIGDKARKLLGEERLK